MKSSQTKVSSFRSWIIALIVIFAVDASISNWNSFNEELTVFATWDAIVEMKSASGLEDKKASDISFTVSAENCKDQVIKFEFVVDFVDDCKKPSHVLSIELV